MRILGSRWVLEKRRRQYAFCPIYEQGVSSDAGNLSIRYCKDLGYVYYPLGQCSNGWKLYKRCKADYERACEEDDGYYVSECQDVGSWTTRNFAVIQTSLGYAVILVWVMTIQRLIFRVAI